MQRAVRNDHNRLVGDSSLPRYYVLWLSKQLPMFRKYSVKQPKEEPLCLTTRRHNPGEYRNTSTPPE